MDRKKRAQSCPSRIIFLKKNVLFSPFLLIANFFASGRISVSYNYWPIFMKKIEFFNFAFITFYFCYEANIAWLLFGFYLIGALL